MNPDKTYSEIKRMLSKYAETSEINVSRLNELYSSLDVWIADGGVKPKFFNNYIMLQAANILDCVCLSGE